MRVQPSAFVTVFVPKDHGFHVGAGREQQTGRAFAFNFLPVLPHPVDDFGLRVQRRQGHWNVAYVVCADMVLDKVSALRNRK